MNPSVTTGASLDVTNLILEDKCSLAMDGIGVSTGNSYASEYHQVIAEGHHLQIYPPGCKRNEYTCNLGPFRVAFCLKTSFLSKQVFARNHSSGNVLCLQVHFHANQTHFHQGFH